ncbi:hypothetical protein ACR2XN_29205 [Klebsiella pneumoniae]
MEELQCINDYFYSFLSEEETMKVTEALIDPDWVIANQDELNQLKGRLYGSWYPDRSQSQTVSGSSPQVEESAEQPSIDSGGAEEGLEDDTPYKGQFSDWHLVGIQNQTR